MDRDFTDTVKLYHRIDVELKKIGNNKFVVEILTHLPVVMVK